jgi:hypothetical protein
LSKNSRIILYIGIIIILIILNGIQDLVKDNFKINELTIGLGALLLIPLIAPYLEELNFLGVGIKWSKKLEKLEEGQDKRKTSEDELSKRITVLENIARKEDKVEPDQKKLKEEFEKISSEFTSKTPTERIITVAKLQQIGSKIEYIKDDKFLIDKLKNGNIGERVGASASLKILPKKEAFNDLLSNLCYTGKGGSFVRYRAAEALNALLKANMLSKIEIEELGGVLMKQFSIEKNPTVKRYLSNVLISENIPFFKFKNWALRLSANNL